MSCLRFLLVVDCEIGCQGRFGRFAVSLLLCIVLYCRVFFPLVFPVLEFVGDGKGVWRGKGDGKGFAYCGLDVFGNLQEV